MLPIDGPERTNAGFGKKKDMIEFFFSFYNWYAIYANFHLI